MAKAELSIDGGLAEVVLNNPPLNLFDRELAQASRQPAREAEADAHVLDAISDVGAFQKRLEGAAHPAPGARRDGVIDLLLPPAQRPRIERLISLHGWFLPFGPISRS